MKRVPRLLLAASTGVLVSVAVSLSPAMAGETGHAPGMNAGQCPTTVVLAARGNNSKDMYTPTRYSTQSQFLSNGREGQNIRSFLHFAEARYQEAHPGQSLLGGTYVLGLDEYYYPAEIALPVIDDTGDIAAVLPHLGVVGSSAATSLSTSLETGIPGVRAAVADYEATSGCTPQYLLIGYSLGATILMPQEQWLSQRGQLAGALYMGTVHQVAADPHVVGAVHSPGALLGWMPVNSRSMAATGNRVLYCIPDDFACDPTPTAVNRALEETDDSPHTRYFLNPETEIYSAEVAAYFSTWVQEAEERTRRGV